MSIPSGALKLVHHGTLGGGEEFTYSLWGRSGSTWTQADLDDWLAAYVGKLLASAAVSSWVALIPNTNAFDYVSAYAYAGGAQAAVQAQVPYDQPGQSTNNAMPNQVATVATLLTGRPGRSYRGRLYLPAPDVTSSTAGQVNESAVPIIAQGAAAHLDCMVEVSTPQAVTPVVMSTVKSAMTDISAVRVDSRFDIQRRRAMSEAIRFENTVQGPWT